MTVEERTVFIMDFINKNCIPTLSGKGKDYAGDDDANQNFKRIAANMGLSKYQIWSVYFNKHIDAVNNSIKKNPDNPERNEESIAESLKDIINYAGIMLSMMEEDSDTSCEHDYYPAPYDSEVCPKCGTLIHTREVQE